MLLGYLQGKEKLWKAFWIYSVVFPVLITFATIAITFLLPQNLHITIAPAEIVIALSTTFGLVAMWQCAYNCAHRFWGHLARLFIILLSFQHLYVNWGERHNSYLPHTLVLMINLSNLFHIVFFLLLVISACKLINRNVLKILIPVTLALGNLFAFDNIIPVTFFATYGVGDIYFHFSIDIFDPLMKKAKSGDPQAAYQLGDAYVQQKNYKEAANWYQIAADKGVIFAKTNLAVLYNEGKGVPKDSVKAMKLYAEAGKAGDSLAYYNLGLSYELGKASKVDYQSAAKYYLLAAQAGVDCAENDLGALYATGKGVTASDVQAISWFSKAAIAGENESDISLRFSSQAEQLNYVNTFAQYRLAITKNQKIPLSVLSSSEFNHAKKVAVYLENQCRQ